MTCIQLIEDTIKYYKDRSKRGVNEGSTMCVYRTGDGKMCAVGRWMDWEKEGSKSVLVEGSIRGLTEEQFVGRIAIYFKPEVKNIPQSLWIELQTYHDVTISPDSTSDALAEERELLEEWKNK